MIKLKSPRLSLAARPSIFSALLAVVALALFGPTATLRADVGHWTPRDTVNANWSEGERARYAVHMILLRGDNNPFHSRILWFQGEDTFSPATTPTLYGGEWGWTPGNDNCSTYPSSNFARLGVDSCLMNPFCSGHAMLADGRVLVAGGDDPVVEDYGEIRSRIFAGGLDTLRGTWSSEPDMHLRRFYPTVTTLRDGRALVTAGHNYRHHRMFGGLRNDSLPSSPEADLLQRLVPIPSGGLDPPVLPDLDLAHGRPTPRYGHTAVRMEDVHPRPGQVYFGGVDSLGPENDTWFQTFSNDIDPLASDGYYAWTKPATGGGPPLPRSDHSAIVYSGLGNTMVIFGGLGADSVLSDVWRFYYDPGQTPPFRWSKITTSGSAPPLPRFGHSAIYDEVVDTASVQLQRMIVFGGTTAVNQNPADSTVYELRFDPGSPNNATWYVVPQVDIGFGFPSPRYWHTMNAENADAAPRSRPGHTDNCHAALMFGGRLDATTCSDELWKLWLFKNHTAGWEKVTGGLSPSARARHSTVLDPAQSGNSARIYVFGGVNGAGGATDDTVYVIDPYGVEVLSWARWAELGFSLAGHTSMLDQDQQAARTAEVFDPGNNTWAAHSSATLFEQFYPPVFLVPGGGGKSRIINVGDHGKRAFWIDIPQAGSATTESWALLPNPSTHNQSQTGVQYRPGRIMVTGGYNEFGYLSGHTRTLDTSDDLSNSWTNSDSMVARLNPNLVLLTTGNVLAVGGNQSSDSDLPIQRPQMWDPDGNSGAGTWSSTTDEDTRLAVQPTIRGYHATAILLPDGRVLSAGGSNDQNNPNSDQHLADIFCPPYLFQTDGTTLAERPTFSNSAKPESLGFGKVFTICVPDTLGITRACLIRPGATTHAVDMNQRYVPLLFTNASNPMRLLVTSPASPDSAPPGDYMLFLTGKGSYADVPSIAKWVRVVARGLDSCDVVPPDSSNDLAADCDPDVTNGWTLSWLAPGDDRLIAASGPATAFEMRNSSNHITNWNFLSATLSSTPTPGVVGTQHTLSTSTSTHRYFRFRTRDDNNQNSGLSDEVYIFNWSGGGFDCYGGEGMMGGDGGGGYRAGRAPGFAGLKAAAEGAISENSILPGARTGEKSRDAWRLASGLATVGASYDMRIRERAGHAAALDQVRLVAVDHAAGLEALSVGEGFALGTRRAAARVTSGEQVDMTANVDGSASYSTAPGETLSVDLGTGGGASPLVVEAAGAWPCALEVLVPDGAGGWRSHGRLQPRQGMGVLALEPPGSDVLKLAVMGGVRLQFVGSLTVAGEAPVVQSASLASATTARLGDVSTLVSGSDNLSATLAGPDTLALAFGTPSLEGGRVRDYFLTVEATPVSAKTMAQLQRTTETSAIPVRFALRQNRPNPFNATTTVWFDLPVGAMVRLDVFDTQGRRVGTLANRYFPPGSHAVPWNPSAGGRRIGPGVYFYRIDAGAFHDRRKMTLIP